MERKRNPNTELNEEYLSRLVDHYKNSWLNRSLKALLKKKSTPLMAWNEIEQLDKTKEPEIEYYVDDALQ